MADLIFPDIVGRFQQGQAFGDQRREQQAAIARRSRLSELAAQAYGATPDARQSILQQAVGVDPQAGLALGENLQGIDERQTKELVNAARFLTSTTDPVQQQGLWQRIRPSLLQRFPQMQLPEQVDDNVRQTAQALVRAYGGQGEGTPAGFQELHLKALAAGLQPGTPGYERAMRIALGTEAGLARTQPKVITTDINGTPTTLTFDPATQSYRIAELSGPAMGQTDPQQDVQSAVRALAGQFGGQITSLRRSPADNIRVDGVANSQHLVGTAGDVVVPQAQRAAFMAAARAQGLEAIDEGDHVHLELPPGARGMPITGRRKEDEAAAVTAAQEAAKLQFLPQQLGMQTQAGIAEAAGKAEAEARVKRDADLATAAQKKYVDASTTLSLLDEAEPLIKKATGSGLGAARDVGAAFVGQSTEGAQAIAALNPIAAALTLAVPRMEGPQSDADRLLYQKAAGDFSNPNLPYETKLAALQQMRRLANKYRMSQGRPPAPRETQFSGFRVLED